MTAALTLLKNTIIVCESNHVPPDKTVYKGKKTPDRYILHSTVPTKCFSSLSVYSFLLWGCRKKNDSVTNHDASFDDTCVDLTCC